MRVEILHLPPDPLRILWTAARTCYSALPPHELWERAAAEDREKMLSLIRKIWEHGHHSVIEHVSVTYAVSGISRTCLAQLTRHRIGVSFSVQSQRHVAAGKGRARFGAVEPPSVTANPAACTFFQEFLDRAQEAYNRLLELGIPKEDARFVLPGAAATNLVVTLNLRSLWELWRKRVAVPGAQWEIKELVLRMVALLGEREPWLGELFGQR